MEPTSNRYDVDYQDLELYKLKVELKEFVIQMKSQGFLSSIDSDDIPSGIENEYTFNSR